MKIPRRAIDRICARVVRDLKEQKVLGIDQDEEVAGLLADTFQENLVAEDRLDEEARALLETHAAAMGSGDIEYQQMLRLVKQKLAKEKKFPL